MKAVVPTNEEIAKMISYIRSIKPNEFFDYDLNSLKQVRRIRGIANRLFALHSVDYIHRINCPNADFTEDLQMAQNLIRECYFFIVTLKDKTSCLPLL